MPSTMNYNLKIVNPAVIFNNVYASGRVVSINLNSSDGSTSQKTGNHFIGNLQTLRVQGTATFPDLPASAFAGIEVKGYRDAEGTELIIEPTAAQVYPDISGGKHSVVFSLDLIINLAPTDVLYLFIKTIEVTNNGNVSDGNTGTFSVSELEVVNRRL